VGKQARNSRREVERAAAAQAALRSQHRRKLLPYWIATGVVILGIAIAIPFVLTSGGGSTSTLTGLRVFAEHNHNHVTGTVTYDRTPPAGGAHSAIWLNCGVYNQPEKNENAVHSIEHGAVWITYQPSLSSVSVAHLQEFARSHSTGTQGYLLLSPYPGLLSPVVASTWGAQLALNGPSDPRLAAFVARYAGGGQGGEPGGECTGGTGSPIT
jgi:hypothetical protein